MDNEIIDENSIDSEDEAQKYDYGLYLLKRLIQIKRSQTNRKRLETLLRAFYRWSYEFPLAQKCDEMSKQLKERNLMMDTVRSSYLRDVVSIKHHLDKINEAEIDDNDRSLVKLKKNMYDLHTLPSVDLRVLVDNVRCSVGQTSAQLRESLVDAGLLDPETLRTLNPWDQSRGYRRLMRIKKGGAMKPPDLEGESIAIAAPSKQKLFIRYCKDCIGFASFIKDWNQEVELSMKFKADFSNIDGLIQEYRTVIEKLNNTIESQEQKIVDLLKHTSELETANAWFEKWNLNKNSKNSKNGGIYDDAYDSHIQYQNRLDMAKAELESFALNSSIRIEKQVSIHINNEKIQRQKLREIELRRDSDSQERVKIIEKIRIYQKEISTKNNEIIELNKENIIKEEEKKHLNEKINNFILENKQLHEVVDQKEHEYATLRDESNAKLEDMNYQIKQLSDDYQSQESTIDELRDNLLTKKMAIQDNLTEITNLRKRVTELEALIPPPKSRYTLKSVAIAVRYLIRLSRTLRRKDYAGLGKLGYEELLRKQKNYVKMLTNAHEKLERKHTNLTEVYAFQTEELLSYRAHMHERYEEILKARSLRKELHHTKSLLRRAEQERDEAIAMSAGSVAAQEIVVKGRIRGALETQHTQHLQQAKIYAQIQRNLSHHLAETLFKVRAVVSSMEIQADMAVLEKPYEASMPVQLQSFISASEASSKAPHSPVRNARPLRDKKVLLQALKTKGRALMSWLKRNRPKAILRPKRVPITLFRQPNTDEDLDAHRKLRAKALNTITHVIHHDFAHMEDLRGLVRTDMKKVQDYIYALKCKHNELLLQVKLLEEELREERMPSQTSKTTRKRIGDIKSSFSHLMKSTDSHKSHSYFSSVLQAIESVQAEHGELYKDKLVQSGKFKLTEVAKAVVRRNSLKGLELAGVSFKAEASGGDLQEGSHSRSPSFLGPGGYPLARLHSVAELDHENEKPISTVTTTAGSAALKPSSSSSFTAPSSSFRLGGLGKFSAEPTSSLLMQVPEHKASSPSTVPSSDTPQRTALSSKVPSFPVITTVGVKQEKGDLQQPLSESLVASDTAVVWERVESPVKSTSSKQQRKSKRERKELAAGEDGTAVSSKLSTASVTRESSAGVGSNPEVLLNKSNVQNTAPEVPSENKFPVRFSPRIEQTAPQTSTHTNSIPSNKTTHTAVLLQKLAIQTSDTAVSTPTPQDHVAERRDAISAVPISPESELGVPVSARFQESIDSDRSFGFVPTTSPAIPPAPPEVKVSIAQEKDTIGFESSDEEEEEEDEWNTGVATSAREEDLDEDVMYMEDLLHARDEMIGLLSRDEVLQNRIKQAEDEKSQLEAQVKFLAERLEKKSKEYSDLQQEVHVHSGTQKQLQADLDNLNHQNELLREIVEEDYRFHSANLEKTVAEQVELERSRIGQKPVTAHQGTQINCAVCAIKDEYQRHNATQQSVLYHNGYDDATIATVHEQFARALNGEVVLIARPRRINKKSHHSNQHDSPEARLSPELAPIRGFEELFEEKRKLEKQAMKNARVSPGGVLEGDKIDNSAALIAQMGFSELLMKHLETNQQTAAVAATTIASKPVYGNYGIAAGAHSNSASAVRGGALSSAGETSKFSRIKKMPPKGSASSGDLLDRQNATNTQVRHSNNSSSNVRPNSASVVTLGKRTESHTAAYLQNRLMTGASSSPQIAPDYSTPHVPLHTVGLASSRPDSTAVYLSNAMRNAKQQQRASSASAARTERTSSAALLLPPSMTETSNQLIQNSKQKDSVSYTEQHQQKAHIRAQQQQPLCARVLMPARPEQRDSLAGSPTLDFRDDLSDSEVEFV